MRIETPLTAAGPPIRTEAGWVLAALLGGLIVGALTLGGQRVLPGATNQLANSGAVWSITAFAAGRFLPVRFRGAVLVGVLALVGAVIGYYTCTTVVLHDDVNAATLRAPAVWLVVGVVAGTVFGLAGAYARAGTRRAGRAVALSSIGAVFVGEGIYQAAANHYPAVATILCAIGIVLPPLFARSGDDRRLVAIVGLPLLIVGAALAGGAYALLNVVLS